MMGKASHEVPRLMLLLTGGRNRKIAESYLVWANMHDS